MVNITIDGINADVPKNHTILSAAKQLGVEVPTLCFLKELNEVAACRICVVEIEGQSRLAAACNTPVFEGMAVKTHSPRVRKARKANLELILSQHNTACTTCVRNENCSLQTLTKKYNLTESPYRQHVAYFTWPQKSPLIRDADKCVSCLRCVNVCRTIQDLGVWGLKGVGTRTHVGLSKGTDIFDTDCTYCGQCITHCPVGALHERNDVETVLDFLDDPALVTVVQVAPAVRTSWAEMLGIPADETSIGYLVDALKKVGFDYVFDTSFSADVTIMEEGSELLSRLGDPEATLPMFTSCCPGWIRFVKSQYPQLLPHISTTKSPQQIFGELTKTYLAQKNGLDPAKVRCISVMPCVSKKDEAANTPFVLDPTELEVDAVLTTRELSRLLSAASIDVEQLTSQSFDDPLGEASGAGFIFGATGGVMEAALRSAYFLVEGTNPDPDAFKAIRGERGWREGSFTVGGTELKIAIAHGLENARALIEAVLASTVSYHFIEIMTCPGGCVGGGGQPIIDGKELAEGRAKKLYAEDASVALRFSHENQSVLAAYDEYLESPFSHKAEQLLHIEYGELLEHYETKETKGENR